MGADGLRLALPGGPGSDLLFRQLSEAWRTIGVTTRRVAPGQTADLELRDTLARFTSPRWYLNQFNCGLGNGLCAPKADAIVRQTLAERDMARRDEVGQMARTLEQARGSIRQQLREIEDMTAARQKLESELSIAREIQQAMLPPGLVIDREHAHLEAYARLEPAKAVGGDFYCFIQTDPDCLWFAIGDVSDKGVPAALFMARTVTVLEVAASTHPSPERVLAEASRRLVQGNDACMFATVLCGRVDVRSGACVLASAGHDAPLLLHADGRHELLPVPPGPPLGFEVEDAFPLWSGLLPAGATLLAWTDGITEAFDVDNLAFGAERIPEALQPGVTAGEQCEALIARVHAFTDPAPQSDDITALAIRRRLDSGPASPEAPPTQENADADATVHPA